MLENWLLLFKLEKVTLNTFLANIEKNKSQSRIHLKLMFTEIVKFIAFNAQRERLSIILFPSLQNFPVNKEETGFLQGINNSKPYSINQKILDFFLPKFKSLKFTTLSMIIGE